MHFFLNESNVKDEFYIQNVFGKYKREFGNEFEGNDFKKYKELIEGLYKSLELIGDGEIIEKSKYDYDGDRLMYKELFKNDTLILVVHAAFKKHTYGTDKMYCYEIGVYRNNPRTVQYGGGYGASGTMEIHHTRFLHSTENYCRNKNVISATCNEIKKDAEENF